MPCQGCRVVLRKSTCHEGSAEGEAIRVLRQQVVQAAGKHTSDWQHHSKQESPSEEAPAERTQSELRCSLRCSSSRMTQNEYRLWMQTLLCDGQAMPCSFPCRND